MYCVKQENSSGTFITKYSIDIGFLLEVYMI